MKISLMKSKMAPIGKTFLKKYNIVQTVTILFKPKHWQK